MKFPGIGSYIGVPVVLSDGMFFGTLCAVDPEPRYLTPQQAGTMTVLARLLATYIERDRQLDAIMRTRRALERQAVILRRQAALLDLAQDAILVRDIESGEILYWNEGAERMYGWAKGEAFGRMTHELLRTEFSTPLGMIDAEVIATGRWEGELAQARRGGERLVVNTRWALQRDDRGEPAAILEINTDVTERKELERRLAEERFRSLVRDTSDIITICDADGVIRYESPSIERVLGYEPEQLIGTSVFDLIHPEDLADAKRFLADMLRAQEFSPVTELRLRHRDGSRRSFEVAGRNLLGEPSVRGMVLNARDLTERKRAEEELRAKHAAEEANRAKSEFLSRISHELRTPLNAILGFGELLTLGELTPRQHRQAGMIVKSGRHLLELIDEVLDIAGIEAGRLRLSLEPVAVQEIALEILDLVRPLGAQRNIHIEEVKVQTSSDFVLADRQRLKQVLLNLLSNAIKYNREGGRVTLSCLRAEAGADGSPRLRIEVSDTGPGIPAEKMERVFVPFDRLDAELTGVEGTGLGLALSERLIEAMGGSMGVESTPGEGSTFYFELPLAVAPLAQHAQLADAASDLAEVHGTAGTVLYIEDNLSNLELIDQILTLRPGVKLLSAMQGQIGLDLAREHRPDLVLLDLHLPDMPGKQVLKVLVADARTRSIPVVVISADASPGEVRRMLSAGARDYLTKPLQVRGFLEVLDETLRNGDGDC